MLEEDQPDEDGLAERYREPEADVEPDLAEPEFPTAPSVDVPEPDPSEVPEELQRGFWTLVLLVNAAVVAVVFGGLLVAADVERRAGALLVVLGLLLTRRAYNRYRSLDERHRSGELTAPDGADGVADEAEQHGGGGGEADGGGDGGEGGSDERNG